MASQGPNFPASCTGVTTVCGGSTNWTSPGNATAEDGIFATISVSTATGRSLVATQYGFAIPAGATINGVVVEVKKKCSSATNGRDCAVKLVKGGAVTGNNYADLTTPWSTVLGYVTYGGPTDLWGLALTPTDINASNFGVSFGAKGTATVTASVDAIRITVYYTTGTVVASAFSADMDIQKAIASTFSLDMDAQKTVPSTLTANMDAQRTMTGNLTADLDAQKNVPGSFAADMLARKTVPSNLSADMDAIRTLSSSITADMLAARNFASTFAADGVVQRNVASSFLGDMDAQRVVPDALTADMLASRTFADAFSTDADIQRDMQTAFSADMDALAIAVSSFTADMDISKTLASQLVLDAITSRNVQSAFAIAMWTIHPFSAEPGAGEFGTFEPGGGGGGVAIANRYVTLVERFRVAAPRPERFRVGQYEAEEV